MTHAFPPRRSSDLAAREIELAAAIRGEVVHQQHAQALDRPALDLGVAAEAERALADVAQRQPCRLGEPGRERNSGRLGASDGIETAFRKAGPYMANGQIDDGAAQFRLAEQPAAIDLDRARPAGGQREANVRGSGWAARVASV